MDPKDVLDPAQIDSQYSSPPKFARWRDLVVDEQKWMVSLNGINKAKTKDPQILARARDVAKRAAAVDTGALEGLYEVDNGFTITVATQNAMWQSAFRAKEEKTRKLIEAQMAGYDEVIDLATKGAPLAEAWIRALHAKICEAQKTYVVLTEQGQQEHELPLGEYKRFPNHVVTAAGIVHPYAPVLQTAEEMRCLITELTSPEFTNAHPVIQSAFAHYSMVWIHPFADGNGRTARALASVFTYRGAWIPFMVLMEHKADYLATLRAADSGDLQTYVDFVFRRSIDAFQLVQESLQAARFPSYEAGFERTKRLHVTKGGYSHTEIDIAGTSLLTELRSKAAALALSSASQAIRINVSEGHEVANFPTPQEGYRRPANPGTRGVSVRFDSRPPAQAQIEVQYTFLVPRDAGADDEIIVIATPFGSRSSFPISAILPKHSTVTQLRLEMFFQGVVGEALAKLEEKGREALSKSGFA